MKKSMMRSRELKKNKSYLEVYARENFGYIKKNETFYQIIKNEK